MKSDCTRLEILLLGPFSVHLVGKPVMDFSSDKERALLAYLAANPNQPHRRERLAGLFWPESTERAARASLRNALAKLRHAIDAAHDSNVPLEVTYQTISFRPEEGCRLDVAAFERYLQISASDSVDDEAQVTNLRQASRLYRGPFMDGFTLAGCPEFEEWVTFQREYFHRSVVEALGRLVSAYEGRGESDNAIEAVRQQLRLEPWLEEAHRRLMTLLAGSGRRTEALAQFQICHNLLVTELSVAPDDETTALYERIRGEVDLPSTLPHTLPPTMARLPATLMPLVDRERELGDLRTLLINPKVRLVTMVGVGGIGKTRLALALAHDQLAQYPDGVAFVSLAGLEDASAVMESVGQSLGLTFHSDGSAKEQVLHFLGNRHLLLVLDNMEHLLSAQKDIADMLRAAPTLTVLCTSRARLGIQGEQLYALDGLTIPPDRATTTADLAGYGAVELFVDHAQRSAPAFELTDENAAAVASICRMMGGLPLGIILAASWIEMLTPSEIAAKISAASNQLFDLLETDQEDVPQRHRSLRAVTDSTWSMLEQDQQTVFAGLSVFRSGFTDQAAHAVTGVTLLGLRRLVAKSCVQSGHNKQGCGRYQIHEYLRQYAYERLQAMPPSKKAADEGAVGERAGGEKEAGEKPVRDRHAAFYLEMLHEGESQLKGGGQQKMIETFALESDNIRAAWHWAAEHRQTARLAQSLQTLCLAYDWQGRSFDGEEACKLAANHITAPRSMDEDRLLVRLYAWQSVFSQVMGHQDVAESLQRQAMQMLDALMATGEAVDAERALVLLNVGINRVYFDDIGAAEQALEESRSAFRAADDRWGEAKALEVLGFCHHNTGQYAKCLDDVRDALSIRRPMNDLRGLASSLMCAGMTYARIGQLEKSEKALRESLHQWRLCGDPQGMTGALSELAALFVLAGKAEEGITYAHETIAILHDLGMPMWIAVEQCSDSCDPFLHSGRYTEAEQLLTEGLAIARQHDVKWPIGAGLVRLAKVAMAAGDFAMAAENLKESIPLLQSIERLDELGDAHISLATCLIHAGDLAEAREHLQEGQQIGDAIDHFATICHGQAASALLAGAEGNVECAMERNAAAVKQPFVANSQWFADIYGTNPHRIDYSLDQLIITPDGGYV